MESLEIEVGGLDQGTQEHMKWMLRTCEKGEVQISHVDSDVVDKPISTVKSDPAQDKAQKLRYLESTAAELGYALVKL